jgi:hypothetical protein
VAYVPSSLITSARRLAENILFGNRPRYIVSRLNDKTIEGWHRKALPLLIRFQLKRENSLGRDEIALFWGSPAQSQHILQIFHSLSQNFGDKISIRYPQINHECSDVISFGIITNEAIKGMIGDMIDDFFVN